MNSMVNELGRCYVKQAPSLRNISEFWNFKRQACTGLLNGLVSASPPLTRFVSMQCLFHGTSFGNCWVRVLVNCLHAPIQRCLE